MEHMHVDNILSLYRATSPEVVEYGMSWYSDAREYAKTLDHRFHRSAGVIAALSPRSPWNNNKAKAAQLFNQSGDGTGCGMRYNVSKAVRIYNGEDALDVLRGEKERNFFLTIVEPDRTDHTPVIDRHAFDIANGFAGNDASRAVLSNKGVYAQYADAYREAAQIAAIPVQHLQAITWCEWRRVIGKSWAG
jgi:hypothetical protein